MSTLESATSSLGSPTKTIAQAKREQKRRPKPKDGSTLICGVCGDRALGYNFDAVSCESCKAFFRRNALKAKPFTCSFEGNCKLDSHTRKFCSGCRLKKCFTIGMKKDWILNEDQLIKRRQRQQKRKYHDEYDQSAPDIQPCSSTSNDFLGDEGPSPYHHQAHSLPHHQHLLPSSTCHSGSDSGEYIPNTPSGYYDTCSSSTSSSPLKRRYSATYGGATSPTSTTPPSAQVHHQSPIPLNIQPAHSFGKGLTMESSTKLPKVEYSSEDDDVYFGEHSSGYGSQLCPIQSPDLSNCTIVKCEVPEDYPIPLNPHISESLSELSKVYDEIFEVAYTPVQATKLVGAPKSPDQLFNMTDVFIRRLIRFAKHIPEFKSLCQGDQIYLLKGGIMEMFVLRSAMSFDSKVNSWKFKMQGAEKQPESKVEGKVKANVMNTLGSSMFMKHMQFVKQLQEITQGNRTILMLLFIIELMSPDRPNLSEKRVVSQSQERHSMWLKAYLESIHTVAEAKILYPKLLVKLLDVRSLGEESCTMVSCLNISNLEPLLVEMFDLNK